LAGLHEAKVGRGEEGRGKKIEERREKEDGRTKIEEGGEAGSF